MKFATAAIIVGAVSAVKVQWTESFGPGDDGIIDALTPPVEKCDERLWKDQRELAWQMDMFSRTCKKEHYDNAVKISEELGAELPKVNSWELMDKAFSFSRVRRYDFVNENMDMLEHFQDNLNMNRSNLMNVGNFIRVCKTVGSSFTDKYKDGEFDAPATHDPRLEAWEEELKK